MHSHRWALPETPHPPWSHLEALLDVVEQHEQTDKVHRANGDRPHQVWPEKAVLAPHWIIVASCSNVTPAAHSSTATEPCSATPRPLHDAPVEVLPARCSRVTAHAGSSQPTLLLSEQISSHMALAKPHGAAQQHTLSSLTLEACPLQAGIHRAMAPHSPYSRKVLSSP